MLEIVSREAWGAAAPRGRLTAMRSPRGVLIHHSGDDGQDLGAVAAIQRYHQDHRGWTDIGYNYLITAAGEVCQGRPEVGGQPSSGAHSPGQNSTRVGICMLGNFSDANEVCFQQFYALIPLCQWLSLRHRIDPLLIDGHRDHRSTECPGDRLYALLEDLRWHVARPFVTSVTVL